MEKAYKLLALQENISNNQAKELIDRGLVFNGGAKLSVARVELQPGTKLVVKYPKKVKKIYEDENIIAVDKPLGMTSDEVEKEISGAYLIHRLDRDTSGVLLLAKSEEFKDRCIEEFKKKRVYKEYVAIVEGRIIDQFVVDTPIKTIKGNYALSKTDKSGKEAKTIVEPLLILEGNKKSKIKVVIETGATHQIRVHLKSAGYPIVGDSKYGGKPSDRLYLHAKKIKIFDYEFESEESF